MINGGDTFEVFDRENRFWGTVLLKWPTNELSSTISGYLKAAPDYEIVRPIFNRYVQLSQTANGTDEELQLSAMIANLGVVLIDLKTGDKHPVAPVFVSERMLFTCEKE